MKRPNGTGTVFKYKDGWFATPPGGNRKKFRTRKEALAYLESFDGSVSCSTISELWSTYLLTGFLDLSDAKQKHYQTVYDRLEPVHNREISSLTIKDLQSLVAPYSEFYAQKDIRTVLSHLYEIAIAQQMVPYNLTKSMHLVSHEEKKGEAWTVDEINKFWNAWNNGDKEVGYVLLMSYTGMMPGEVLNVRRNMIDYEAHEIRGAGIKTKVRKDSPIVLCDKIVPVLQELMSDSLVLWPFGKHCFYDHYYAAIKRCGVRELPPYSCRHTMATLVVNETSPLVAQKIMRHSQVTTTQRYVHPSSDTLLDAVNKL